MKAIVSAIILGLVVVIAAPAVSLGKGKAKVYYRIHEASFKKAAQAESEVKALNAKGYKAYYKKVKIPGKGLWYRVYVGQYGNADNAAKAAAEMKQKHAIDYAAVERSDFSSRKEIAPVSKSPKETKTAAIKTPTVSKKGQKGESADKTLGVPKGSERKPMAAASGATAKNGKEVAASKKEQAGAKPTEPPAAPTPSPPARPPVSVEPQTRDPIFNAAMQDFQARRYESALVNLKKLHASRPSDPVIREKVLRRLADTYFFLGEKNGKQDYFNAVDYYKEILNSYPDIREGNDLVYLRMAKCYDQLNFFYEANQSLDKLAARYPESPYAADAMFMAADMFNKLGKVKEASEKAQAYLKKYPDGAHAKHAHFIVADGYYRLNQPANADIWYGEALKKWPDLSDVPRFMLLDLGYHYYRSRRFNEANDIFSYYVSMYPDDEWSRMAMLAMGRTLAELNQAPLALKVFSRVIEKYPESKEAKEAAVAMAGIGVEKPGLKIPTFMAAVENYREPIAAYDNILTKAPEGDMSEQVLALKGHALSKAGRYKEAFDVYGAYLKKYPKGKYLDEVLRNYKLLATRLVDLYYDKKDYVAVADMYFAAFVKGKHGNADSDTYLKIGESLKAVGLYDDASSVYNELAKAATSTQNENKAILSMAEIDVLKGKYKDAEQKLQSILNQTKNKDMAVMNKAKAMMADVTFHQGLYDRAVQSYRDILNKTKSVEEGLPIYDKYADALKEKNMCALAIRYYQKIIESASKDEKKYSPRYLSDAYMGLGDCYFAEKRFKEGLAMYRQAMTYVPEQGQKMWSIYRIGKEAWRLQDYPEADKAFGLLKASQDGPFWSKVVEYQTESEKWSRKYSRYLK